MNWHPNSEQIQQFIKLQSLLKSWNNQLNLTRLISGNDYWVSQIFDSLWPLEKELIKPLIDLNFIDVGSGCGLPGFAIAIALPNSKITLIEANSRKASALENISTQLGLSERISIRNERAEVSGHQPKLRGQFDFAMARAVASAPVVAEYLIPLLKQHGQGLIYKGKYIESEQQKLSQALIFLNGKIKKIQQINLPEDKGVRHLIRVISTESCPSKYPRKVGLPSKRPLGS
tara:strand:+ start:34015 stop:34707 length:693 start_codon:yes stop_codon:yes gene_type:complete